MPRRDSLIDDYARVLLAVGVNLQQGQLLAIDALVEHAPLVRALVREAYELGASYVDVFYSDDHVKRSLIAGAPDEAVGYSPPWLVERMRALGERQGAHLALVSTPEPDFLTGLDEKRIGRSRMLELTNVRRELVGERRLVWSIAGCPTEEWALQAFGEPDVERLWKLVGDAVRLDEEDPVAAWWEHNERLQARSKHLTERAFDSLRFEGPGTDLTIGLLPGASWMGGSIETAWGQQHIANLPTEEVFTSPDWHRAEGHVRSTRPLSLMGAMVTDLELRFEGGKIVEVGASTGADVVRTELETDEQAAFLGEVALVDANSRVWRTGTTFFHVLFDENATSHIAYGTGFDFLAEGANALPGPHRPDDRLAGGGGGRHHAPSGEVVPILRDGVWQLG